MKRMPGRYAAIDIGTVTCRMLVADIDEQGSLVELYHGYGITNLGESVDATGTLKLDAMQRVVKQVSEFLQVIESYRDAEHPDIRLVAMATSASRDAKNSAEFLEMLHEVGIQLTIIPGELEARLSFNGVASDFPGENLLMVDIGGGSTEYGAGHAGEDPLLSQSFNVGCRRVTERFFLSDPPNEAELNEARQWALEVMKPYFDQLAGKSFTIDRMVAVAGTATSVVSIHKHMDVYDSSEVHRSAITKEELEQVYRNLKSLTLDQRRKVVGLDPGRAPVIVAGLLILDVAMELSGQDSFTASEADILQGIILYTAEK